MRSLDEWVANNKLILSMDIATHIEVFIKDSKESEMLLRLIMTSIRQDCGVE